MKKNIAHNPAWFIGISLFLFAVLFLGSTFIHNSYFRAQPAGRIIVKQKAAVPNQTDYATEETADPYVTRVIKK